LQGQSLQTLANSISGVFWWSLDGLSQHYSILCFYYFLLDTTFAAKSGAKPTDFASPQ